MTGIFESLTFEPDGSVTIRARAPELAEARREVADLRSRLAAVAATVRRMVALAEARARFDQPSVDVSLLRGFARTLDAIVAGEGPCTTS